MVKGGRFFSPQRRPQFLRRRSPPASKILKERLDYVGVVVQGIDANGSFLRSGTFIETTNRGALRRRTSTERIPNLWKQLNYSEFWMLRGFVAGCWLVFSRANAQQRENFKLSWLLYLVLMKRTANISDSPVAVQKRN